MGLFDKIKQMASEKANSVLTSAIGTVRATLDDVTSMEPQFNKVGYRLKDISIEMGLPPQVILQLTREFEAPEEAFQAAKLDRPDSKMLATLLGTLWQVNVAVRGLQLKDRPFKGVEIEVGLSPVVRMKFGEPEILLPPSAPESEESPTG